MLKRGLVGGWGGGATGGESIACAQHPTTVLVVGLAEANAQPKKPHHGVQPHEDGQADGGEVVAEDLEPPQDRTKKTQIHKSSGLENEGDGGAEPEGVGQCKGCLFYTFDVRAELTRWDLIRCSV